MNFLTFDSSRDLNDFLKRKLNPKIENQIEYCIMEKFPKSRILFTAEHAMSTKIPMKNFGENAFAFVGDKNTDVLAKLAAYYTRTAYIVPLFSRIHADASRPVEDLGKGTRLFVKVTNAEHSKLTTVLIHTDKKYLNSLLKFHEIIEKIKPNAIVSIHGMHRTRPFDVLFGFGNNYEGIKNKDMALKFKNEFIAFLDKVAGKKLKKQMKIGLGVWRFSGIFNPVINKHVIEHNKKTNDTRLGMQVEVNWKGRTSKGDPNLPKHDYQILFQTLGEFISERWPTILS